MRRWLAAWVGLAAATALAQGARVAVHPLEALEFSPLEQKELQGVFVVSIARIPEVRLAGGAQVDDALRGAAGAGCEAYDACLRDLAEHTGSLYAVYARLRPDALGGEFTVTARVVRGDGQVARRLTLSAPKVKDRAPVDTAAELVAVCVKALELGKLPSTLPAVVVSSAPELPPPLVPAGGIELQPWVEAAPVPKVSARQTVGFAVFGLGLATICASGALFGVAGGERAALQSASAHEVPARAANADRDLKIAAVVLPVGAGLAVAGGLLGWWPQRSE